MFAARYSRVPICALERCPRGEFHDWLLSARIHPLPKLASSLSCTCRGECLLSLFTLANISNLPITNQLSAQQQLYSRVQFVASRFKNETERTIYQAAARDWRMPYWEWAQRPSDGGPVYLDDFGQEMITVYGPNGWQQISNPLYSYHFTTTERLAFDFPIVWPAFI